MARRGKRPAEEPLEETAQHNPPASKRARVDDEEPPPPPPPPPSVPARENGAVYANVYANGQTVAPPPPPPESEAGHLNPENEALLEGIDQDESAVASLSRQSAPTEGYSDLYLDTIDRTVLDFDFEKLCSITLSNINVYACLVCGRYFQGRGPRSQAYFHALEDNHHVYVNMETKKVYVLPEGYEVHSRSLEDIKFVVDPWLSRQEVLKLDKEQTQAWDLSGKKYTPGFVGLNNLKDNDYFNVVVQALAHVPPLRNFFMLEDLSSRLQLAQRFGVLVRKLWNPKSFKAHVSPHELLQEIALRSGKRFTLTDQSDPVDLLSWLLNNLHIALGGSLKKPGSSIIHRVFQGTLQMESQAITARADAGDRLRFEDADVEATKQRFMVLTLDLPPSPLFVDAQDQNAIPQVPLAQLLSKYDGIRSQERLNTRVRYRLLHPLPPYLIFHVKRFSANKFIRERNPTIVTFSPRSLDMSPYVQPNAEHPPGEPIWYDLVANITHEAVRVRDDSVEGEQERKVWRAQVRERAGEVWWEIQDLWVEKADEGTLFTKETYVLVWEKRQMPKKV